MKSQTKLLSVLLTLIIVLGFVFVPANKVSADAEMYTFKTGYMDYGTYPIFHSVSDLSQYVMGQMISRNSEFTFYYAAPFSEKPAEYFKSVIAESVVHNGNPKAGDYLSKAYNNYYFSYKLFKNCYSYEGSQIDLYLMTFNFSFFTTIEDENYVDSRIDEIIKSLNISNKSDYEKVLAIYTWITANVSYDQANANQFSVSDTKTFTSYNALNKKSAVCQGVATLFYRMLLTVGIENRITNNATHCWNLVKVDGSYYYCDPTWDLGFNPSNFQYFMCGRDSSFESEHFITDNTMNLGYSVVNNNYAGAKETSKPVANNKNETKVEVKSNDEGVKGFASRLYTVALNRDADESGLAYWADELSSGRVDGAAVARSFINSEEFKNMKLNDSDYLSVLYSVFFNREMDDAGRDYWLSELKSNSTRETVLEGFIGSNEWKDICKKFGINPGSAITVTSNSTSANDSGVSGFANRLYVAALGRDADKSGLDYWVGELTSKRVTGTSAAHQFIFSQEFINSKVSNKEFINRLYVLFMNREADEGGFNYWNSLLVNGSSREDVFNGFSTSDEFGNICKSYGIAR